MGTERPSSSKRIAGGAASRFRFKIEPEWRSPRTGSNLIERLMLAALVPVSVLIWLGIGLVARTLAEALS